MGAMPPGRKGEDGSVIGRLWCLWCFWCLELGALGDDRELAAPEPQGGLDGLEEPRLIIRRELDAVLDHAHQGRQALDLRRLIGAMGGAVEPDAQVTLRAEELEEIRRLGLGRHRHGEGYEHRGRLGVLLFGRLDGFQHLRGDRAGGLDTDFAAALRAKGLGQPGHQDFEVIVDLGDGAHGRAGGLDVVGLLDGDGGGDAVNGVDLRLVHAVHELPGVGAESLDVAALALGVDGIEGEAGLAAAAGARDDVEFPERNIEVESLQIILSDAANLDGVALGELGLGFFQGTENFVHKGRLFKCHDTGSLMFSLLGWVPHLRVRA